MLSMISLIYDPREFSAPFMLERRRILQGLSIKTNIGTVKSAVKQRKIGEPGSLS